MKLSTSSAIGVFAAVVFWIGTWVSCNYGFFGLEPGSCHFSAISLIAGVGLAVLIAATCYLGGSKKEAKDDE
jgi:hypothetical protein